MSGFILTAGHCTGATRMPGGERRRSEDDGRNKDNERRPTDELHDGEEHANEV
jgi:hypothetical protein